MTTHEQHAMTDSPEETRRVDEGTTVTQEQAQRAETQEQAQPVETPAPSAEAPPAPEAREAAPPTHEHEHESSADEALFAGEDLADLRARWAGVQAAFVDDPKDCVHKADALVSDLVEQLTNKFAHARSRLEEQWSRGEEASTEDLRMALMHYREFFERLLAV